MDNTVIQQGSFTSTGANVTLKLRNGVNWIKVYNYTQSANGTGSGQVVAAAWFTGMLQGSALVVTKTATTLASINSVITTGGFTIVDSSVQQLGPLQSTITAISTASTPVVTNSGTNGLVAGNVVRLFNVAGAQQLGGYDFTVGYNTLSTTTFSLDYMAQLSVAGTTGSFRLVPYTPLFYPTRRRITSISQAAQCVVVLSVTHGYQVGQSVRVLIPDSAWGMPEIDFMLGNIVAVNTATTGAGANSITLDINTTNFTPFTFPLSAQTPFSPAEIVPVGEDTALANSLSVNVLTDATINQGYIGVILGGGASGVAGANNDVIYWEAGSSFSVNGM